MRSVNQAKLDRISFTLMPVNGRSLTTRSPTITLGSFSADMRSLLDDLVCKDEEMRGHRDPERLGDLEVDDQHELVGSLHGEIAWPGPLQNLVNEDGGPVPQEVHAHPIGHKVGWLSAGTDCRQAVLQDKVPNPFGVPTEPRRVRHHEGLRLALRYRAEGTLDVVGAVHLHRVECYPQFPGGALQR